MPREPTVALAPLLVPIIFLFPAAIAQILFFCSATCSLAYFVVPFVLLGYLHSSPAVPSVIGYLWHTLSQSLYLLVYERVFNVTVW
jgi:hypothetical protein